MIYYYRNPIARYGQGFVKCTYFIYTNKSASQNGTFDMKKMGRYFENQNTTQKLHVGTNKSNRIVYRLD